MHPINRPSAFAAQIDLFTALAPQIDALVERHLHLRPDWQPGDLLDFGSDEGLAELRSLRERARALATPLRTTLALHLLTEEGLPQYHRLFGELFGSLPAWERWLATWSAEEERHGQALRDYGRDAALFHMAALDRLLFTAMSHSYAPQWAGSPYGLLAHTALQERMTQAVYHNIARTAAGVEPLLQNLLSHLAYDEQRHCAFYRDAFALALQADPDNALLELAAVAPQLCLPGADLDSCKLMTETQHHAGLFGPREYSTLVAESLEYWGIAELEPHGGNAREARDTLLGLPLQLRRLADRLDEHRQPHTLHFDFIRTAPAALA